MLGSTVTVPRRPITAVDVLLVLISEGGPLDERAIALFVVSPMAIYLDTEGGPFDGVKGPSPSRLGSLFDHQDRLRRLVTKSTKVGYCRRNGFRLRRCLFLAVGRDLGLLIRSARPSKS